MCNPRGNQSKFFYGSRLWLYSVLLLSAIIGVRAEQLPIQVYTTANNLIYEGVRRIYQDSRGLIWFSTPVGVSRFDGYQFTNYGMDDGLTYPGIVDLVEDANGIYWFGTTGYGIYRFDPRSPISSEHGKSVAPKINFVNYSVSDNAASNHIYRFFKTSKGEVLVGTAGGLFRLDGSESNRKFSRVELNVPSAPNEYFGAIAFAEDAEGNLWIGHQRGLTRRLTDGRMITYAVQPNAASDWIYSLTIDQNNRIWAITDNRGLIVFNPEPVDSISDEGAPRQIKFTTDNRFSGNLEPGSAYRFKPEENLADGEFLNVLETSDGTIWLTARTKGLVKFDGREFRLYTKANGLSDNRTDDLLEDSFGNLWVGSGFGAMKFPRKGFVTYNVEDGLASEVIFNVFQDRAGVLYATGSNWKINQFDGKRFVSVAPNLPESVGSWRFHDIIVDHAGEWWLATRKGLYRFPAVEKIEQLARAKPVAVYNKTNGLPEEDIFALFEDSRGDVWISFWRDTPGRLTRWERGSGKFYNYAAGDGIPASCVPAYFREDAAGNVFIGCYSEHVVIYQAGRFFSHSLEASANDKTIHDILIDSQNRLWVGMPLGGVKRIDNPLTQNPALATYTAVEGLSDRHIQYLAEDDTGKIYIVTSRGMDSLDAETGKIKHYTLADGLAAAGTGSAFRDSNGTLWLGTFRGLSKFVPEPDKSLVLSPIFISRLRIGGKDEPISTLGEEAIDGLTVESDQRQMEIDYYSLSLASGEILHYQYKLEGTDADWSEPTTQRTVSFPNISPGSYRFLVRTVDPDGFASTVPASVSFTVLRPIWQRDWFLALVALSLIAGIYGFYQYRLTKLLEIERTRTRIATDLHDDIGASLSRIAMLSEVVKRQNGVASQDSAKRLTQIADNARDLVDSMSDIVWSIDPRRDSLSNVLARVRSFASDTLGERGVKWSLEVAPELNEIHLSSDQKRGLYLIFKEALINIARHAKCQNVRLKVSLNRQNLIAEIADDGGGFAKESDENSRGGRGLENMQKRAKELGGQLEINSSEKGTNLILTFPRIQTKSISMLFRLPRIK